MKWKGFRYSGLVHLCMVSKMRIHRKREPDILTSNTIPNSLPADNAGGPEIKFTKAVVLGPAARQIKIQPNHRRPTCCLPACLICGRQTIPVEAMMNKKRTRQVNMLHLRMQCGTSSIIECRYPN